MSVYGKALIRGVIFCALVLGAIVLSKPAAVSAFEDCCQMCGDRLQACLNNCKGNIFCEDGCRLQENKCIEICPACIGNN